MNPQQLISQLGAHHVTLAVDGGKLRYKAPEPVPAAIIDGIKEHKAQLQHWLELGTWATELLGAHPLVWIETPDDPLDERRIIYPATTLEQVLFYRLRSEAWDTWGRVRAGKASKVVATWGTA